MRENGFRFGEFPHSAVQAFNDVGCVNDVADFGREVQECDQFRPIGTPAFDGVSVLAAPFFLEAVKGLGSGLLVGGAVNFSQIGGELPALGPGDELAGVADLVDDAQLGERQGEGGFDGLGEAGEVVCASDEDVLHAPAFKVAQYREPERGALCFRNPDAQNLLQTLVVQPDDEVDGLVHNLGVVPDFEPDAVQPNDEVNLFQGAVLPCLDVVEQLIGDVGDGSG